MTLLAPSVIGPVSECSKSIRVEGQISGATVKLFITGQAAAIGGGVATWSDQVFPLNASVTLAHGHSVQATQTLAGQTSPLGPGITVQKKPPSVGVMAFQSHLYHCGTCVWLVGAVPGAEVTVKVGNALRGSTVSADGSARIGLNQAIGANDILTIQQTACGMAGPPVNGPHPDPVPAAKRQLPAPAMPGPLKQCDPAVLVTNVLEGATVTLNRTAAPPESACFDATGLWFLLSKPLMLNETVTAEQAYPRCDIPGTPTPPVKVGSAAPVPPPVVAEPLCAGQASVTVSDYQPGAQIEIFQNHVSLGIGQASEQPSFPFPVAPLTGGAVITARQTLCHLTSVDSNAVTVDAAPAAMPTPQVPGPLYACSSVVRVENLHVGARVYVFSTLLGAEIGDTQAFATTVDVPVAPLLIQGDRIYAFQIGCGHTSHNSAPPQPVQHEPALHAPQVAGPLDDCMTAVPVSLVVPGAQVNIYVNNAWRGGTVLGGASGSVPISGRLHAEDAVVASQELCGVISPSSKRVIVAVSHARNWPMYHHDPQHTGLATCSDITSSNVGTLIQAYPAILLNGDVISAPAVADGKIYVGSSVPGAGQGGGTLYRIDVATGAIEDQFSFVTPAGQGSEQGETGIGCTPAVTGGNVYFSGLDGNIRCVNASTFQLLWTTDLRHPDLARNQPVSNPAAETWTSPLVVNGRVYVGAGVGEPDPGAFGFIYCLDAGSGDVIWLFCTNQFTANTDNQPNMVPGSTVGGAIPPGYHGFTIGPEPLSRGASVWSSCAYHAGLNRIFVCTGNPDPDSPLPNTRYSSGIIAVDASNGTFHGFFQPTQAESYRPNDTDVDFGGSPALYTRSGQDVVAFAGKNGAAFLLDPATMNKLAFRQLLPTFANGNPIPAVDAHTGPGENKSGVFGTPTVDPAWGHVYFGLGGYEGVDKPTTPFMRVCYWDSDTLADAWPVVVGADTITRYSTAQPPMYTTTEAGLSSPVVVNDVVFVSTSAPALYAFSSANGIPLWTAPGFPQHPGNTFSLGPAVYGDSVVIGAGSEILVYRL
jgi:outer membrane protein assembly factor BamB